LETSRPFPLRCILSGHTGAFRLKITPMLNDIPQCILNRMRYLEEIDKQDLSNGTARMKRLRQIPPETGKFITMLAAAAPDGQYIEIGTSAGYSTMWLALACRSRGIRIKTFEILTEKAAMAKETFRLAEVEDVVDFVHGDALEHLDDCRNIAFCFLDAEKEIYGDCYEKIIPKMVPGGIFVADNAISHEVTLRPILDRAMNDNRIDALIVPIGKGELVCRKL